MIEWEGFVGVTGDCNKLVLEGLDGFLSTVPAVVVGWDKLMCHVVELDSVLEDV
jgi:hypothetical protein